MSESPKSQEPQGGPQQPEAENQQLKEVVRNLRREVEDLREQVTLLHAAMAPSVMERLLGVMAELRKLFRSPRAVATYYVTMLLLSGTTTLFDQANLYIPGAGYLTIPTMCLGTVVALMFWISKYIDGTLTKKDFALTVAAGLSTIVYKVVLGH